MVSVLHVADGNSESTRIQVLHPRGDEYCDTHDADAGVRRALLQHIIDSTSPQRGADAISTEGPRVPMVRSTSTPHEVYRDSTHAVDAKSNTLLVMHRPMITSNMPAHVVSRMQDMESCVMDHEC